MASAEGPLGAPTVKVERNVLMGFWASARLRTAQIQFWVPVHPVAVSFAEALPCGSGAVPALSAIHTLDAISQGETVTKLLERCHGDAVSVRKSAKLWSGRPVSSICVLG